MLGLSECAVCLSGADGGSFTFEQSTTPSSDAVATLPLTASETRCQ
eukprot:COSAG06_NODE_33432_length_490_cov_0.580563_2_plen_45_part_01